MFTNVFNRDNNNDSNNDDCIIDPYNMQKCDIPILRNELRNAFMDSTNEFNDPEPLIGTTVRLVFQDCGGPDTDLTPNEYTCNGCIDINNEFHNGLYQGAIILLDDVYYGEYGTNWSRKMSRSDMWAAAGK